MSSCNNSCRLVRVVLSHSQFVSRRTFYHVQGRHCTLVQKGSPRTLLVNLLVMPPHIDDKLHAVIPLVHRYGWQGANYAAYQSSTLIFGTGGCRIIRLNTLCSLIYDDQFGIDGCHVAGRANLALSSMMMNLVLTNAA